MTPLTNIFLQLSFSKFCISRECYKTVLEEISKIQFSWAAIFKQFCAKFEKYVCFEETLDRVYVSLSPVPRKLD